MIRIKELCTDTQTTMKELGNYVGLSESAISMYANNKRQPDCSTLSKMAEFFDVSTDYLLSRTNVKKVASESCFNKHEISIIEAYRNLSTEGQFEVDRFLEYAQERYKKDNTVSIMENRK